MLGLNRAARRLAGGLLVSASLALAGAGCAPLQSQGLLAHPGQFAAPVELTAVPFFQQAEYQCGPAALAMALRAANIETEPGALGAQVYLPAREGSLQAEMLAATRRHGHIPYVLRPRLDALLAEVADGRPVIVLQNLAFGWYPKWHYAVLVGFDLARDELVLRSGIEARHVVPLATFERTWARGGNWAMIVLSPGQLPATAEEQPYLESVVALERLGQWSATAAAYEAATRRWPQSLPALMGLGNSRHARGDYRGAAQAFRLASERHPGAAPAFNNLAEALAELGQLDEAEVMALRAIELGGQHADLYRATLAEIRARRGR